MRSRAVRMGELKVISARIDEIGSGELIKACERIVGEDENAVVVVGGASGGSARMMMMAGRKAVEKGVDCGRIVLKVSRMIGGGGGGRPNFAQGGGTRVERLDDAIRVAVEEISRLGEG
jgi:alanyl-tRNA synthetase